MKYDGKSLAECIADDITSMIVVEKRFAPGSRLLNETDFSKELFISRSTFREAIKILSERGIVEVRHGSGTFVAKDALSGADRKTYSGINALELNEIRLMIEPEAAYLAAMRASDNELRVLPSTVPKSKKRYWQALTGARRKYAFICPLQGLYTTALWTDLCPPFMTP